MARERNQRWVRSQTGLIALAASVGALVIGGFAALTHTSSSDASSTAASTGASVSGFGGGTAPTMGNAGGGFNASSGGS